MNMEALPGAFPEGEWDFSRIFCSEDHQLDFDQLLSQNEVGLQINSHLAFCPNPEVILNMDGFSEGLFFNSWNSLNPDLHQVSQENSGSSHCSSIPSSNPETYFFSDSTYNTAPNNISMSMDFCLDEKNSNSFPEFPEIQMTEAVCVAANVSSLGHNAGPDKELQLKRKFDNPESEVNPSDNAKKKTRVARDVAKIKKNAKAKRPPKLTSNNKEDEERNGGQEGQSSSGCSSEEDNGSQDSNTDSKISEALNSNGKARAGRGSATDPQSLYARKRRERINERLRILQNLVPNGTKVDISTMLEEAVHYVKFLQLQIKLLSSDDLWMYAPIAYNGMDIGLNHKISKFL